MEAAMLIGGEWRQAASNEEIEVVNPATEDVVGERAERRRRRRRPRGRDGQAGVPGVGGDRHREAGARSSRGAAALIEERAKDIAALLTSEQGKPILEARGEVTHLAHGVRYYAEAAHEGHAAPTRTCRPRSAPPTAR